MHYLIYQKHPLSNERVLHKEGGLIITITDNLYDFAKELFQKHYDRYLFYDCLLYTSPSPRDRG